MLRIVRCFYVVPGALACAGLVGWVLFCVVLICGLEAFIQNRDARKQRHRIKACLAEWDEEAELGNDWPWLDE